MACNCTISEVPSLVTSIESSSCIDFYVPNFCRALWMFNSPSRKIIDYSSYSNHRLVSGTGSPYQGYDFFFSAAESNYMNLSSPSDPTSTDITTAPLAIFCTIKIISGSSSRWILVKNNNNGTKPYQYGMFYSSSNNNVLGFFNNSAYGNTGANSIVLDDWNDLGMIWDGTNVKYYLDFKNVGTDGNLAGTLTSYDYFTVGTISPPAAFINASYHNIAIYKSSNLNDIMNHRKSLCAELGRTY